MKRGVILLILAILYVSNKTEGLRCRTDEGLSHDEAKRVTRTCMRRLTSEDGDNYDEYENYDSNESGSSEFGRDRSNSHSNNNNNNRGRKNNNHKNNNRRNQNRQGSNQGRDHQGYDSNSRNNRQNWNVDWNRRYKRQIGYPYGSQTYNPFGGSAGYDFNRNSYSNSGFDFYQGSESSTANNNNHRTFDSNNNGNSFSTNNRGNSNFNSNSNDNSQSSNKSCLMQCFFEEMKMTSNEGLPDRHKVLHVITEEIRDRELKDFYTDSIQECFHILDLGNKSDKCEYSKNLVSCLSERAKTNCDDWNGSTSILFN